MILIKKVKLLIFFYLDKSKFIMIYLALRKDI